MNPWDADTYTPEPIRKRRVTANTLATGEMPRMRPMDGAKVGGSVADRYADSLARFGSHVTWDENISYWGVAFYAERYDLRDMRDGDIPDDFIDEIAGAIVEDIERDNGPLDGEHRERIRRGVRTALRKKIERDAEYANGGRRFVASKRKAQANIHPRFVRNLIGGMGDCDFDAVRELSPCLDFIEKPGNETTAMFMRAAFATDEILHVFRDDVPTVGIPNKNIRHVEDWLAMLERGETLGGDLIVPNPFTGDLGMTTDGKESYIAQSCLASFPFMVLEMDDAAFAFGADGDKASGLSLQCAFWRAFILHGKLAPALVSLTYSGGKSIHGLLYVGCATQREWEWVRDRVRGLLASDTECVIDSSGKQHYPYRIDNQALRVRQGSRLPGVTRFDNGREQTLLYLNPQARTGNMWIEREEPPPTPIDPNGEPPCGLTWKMRDVIGPGCGVCQRFFDCPFVDPRAQYGTTILKKV